MTVPAHGPSLPLDPGHARNNGLTFSMCSTAHVHPERRAMRMATEPDFLYSRR